MSIYRGELTTKCVIESAAKIKKSFPALPADFFDVFSDRIKENGFCDERLRNAVNNVIDNCIYPTPTIAQFISFNKNIKIYSYYDMINMREKDPKVFEYYLSVKIPGMYKPMYASAGDIEKYKLIRWNPIRHKVPSEEKETQQRDNYEDDLMKDVQNRINDRRK